MAMPGRRLTKMPKEGAGVKYFVLMRENTSGKWPDRAPTKNNLKRQSGQVKTWSKGRSYMFSLVENIFMCIPIKVD